MNALFERILSRYQIKDMRDRQNAVYEIAQIVALAGLNRGDSLIMLPSTVELACGFSISFQGFLRTWTSHCREGEVNSSLRIISSLSSKSFITSAGMLKLAKRVLREFVWKVIL